MIIISDDKIKEYISELKIIPKNFNITFKDKGCGHMQFNHYLTGENGNTFYIGIRESKFNPSDFSVIFGVKINGKVFILARYNGNHGEHTNKIDNKSMEGSHIHRATKIYQERGFEEEAHAEKTAKYSDWRTALKLLYNENNFELETAKDQKRITQIWKAKQS